MKTFLLLTLLIGFCLNTLAEILDSSWIDTMDSSFTVKKITIKKNEAVIQLKNGEKCCVALEKIKCYIVNGKTFKKLALYLKGKPTNHFVFMELVKCQEPMRLYKYYNWSYNPNLKLTNYLLYNGDELVMEYDESSCP